MFSSSQKAFFWIAKLTGVVDQQACLASVAGTQKESQPGEILMRADWQDTRLWKKLQGTAVEATLRECMPGIQQVLEDGGTMPLDFTLHDADHSFRVAERAADLLPEDVLSVLSIYDAAQLLLAAYLHDIGMSPSRDISRRHLNFIIGASGTPLSNAEQADLQRWLDSNWGGIVPPISPTEIGDGGVSKAEEIHAYYCRAKHNDWSEQWIREHLPDLKAPLYHDWIDDLVSLCRSHHEGLQDLRGDRFDLRIVGGAGDCLNLRYLAALLRTADVMEFDPERTPDVILRHRSIVPKSKIYWKKDHSISFRVTPEENGLLLVARTPDSAVHRAVLDTINWVNSELNTCATLYHEGQFQKGSAPLATKQRYKWPWPSQLHADVREKDGSFVYIDGGFRPDKTKILELLSGTNLYGTRLAAIRELLQNAVDAVREQIALERITKEDPEDEKWDTILGSIHKIRITFELDGQDQYLVCVDDGVGMDRNIIENHLLISGSGSRGDLVALERKARQQGFNVGRTGQFGIGLLSYFMIADSLSISTRRSSEAGDTDGTGWKFSIDGLSSFGELRTESRSSKGTIVRLKLNYSATEDSDASLEKIQKYICDTLKYSPCQVDIIDQINGTDRIILPQGWTSSSESWKERARLSSASIDKPRSNDESSLPFDELDRQRKTLDRWAELVEESESLTLLHGPLKDELPQYGAKLRGWVPYLKLEGGASLVYMQLTDGTVQPLLDKAYFRPLRGHFNLSWRGFSVRGRAEGRDNGMLLEINCTENGEIAVDRNRINFDGKLSKFLSIFESDLLTSFLEEHKDSDYSLLNCLIASRSGLKSSAIGQKWKPMWASQSDDDLKWKDISFPCTDILAPKYFGDRYPTHLSLNGELYSVMPMLWQDKYTSIHLSNIIESGDLCFASINGYYLPALGWKAEPDFRNNCEMPFCSEFPEEWESIALVSTPQRPILNINHPGVRDLSGFDWLDKEMSVHEAAALVDNNSPEPSFCRRFVLANLRRGARFWNALRDNFPDAFKKIIATADFPNGEIRAWLFHGSFDSDVTLILNGSGAMQGTRAGVSQRGQLLFPDGRGVPFHSRELAFVQGPG